MITACVDVVGVLITESGDEEALADGATEGTFGNVADEAYGNVMPDNE